MCLELGFATNDTHDTHIPDKVERLRPDAMVAFWKIYLRSNDGELRSPLFHSRSKSGCVAKNGWHVSNRKFVKINGWERNSRMILRGIHVYTGLEIGRKYIKENGLEEDCILVKVQARRRDIIAYDCCGDEAVCMRVYVPSRDWNGVPFPTKVCHGRIR